MQPGYIAIAALLVISFIAPLIIWSCRLVERHTFSRTLVGQVVWEQKAKIPGFKQYIFIYKKRGRPYIVSSRLLWHNTKLNIGGLYQIQVFHLKIQNMYSASWAVPVLLSKMI